MPRKNKPTKAEKSSRRAAPLEKVVVNRGMDIGKSLGWLPVKFHGGPFTPRGFPDVLFFKDGVTKFVEYKRPGETPTAVQCRWHTILLNAGFEVAVIDEAKETRWFLQGGGSSDD